MLAGRIWWAMRYWGFTNVLVLNGGWQYWLTSNFPVSNLVPAPVKGSFKADRQPGLRLSLDEFLQEKQEACVIDSRGKAGYAGTSEDPRTGHIPGAINIPYSDVLDSESGLFMEPEQTVEVFDRKAPGWRQANIIASCGSGYAATVTMIALCALGARPSLYDGSMAQWKQNPDRDVEQL